MKKHLALDGFMASGKSTIGKKLARTLKCAFHDIDDIVVAAHGDVSDIFYNQGEKAFRTFEHDAIAQVIETGKPGVIALGGGAATYEPNQQLLKKRMHRVFIKCSPEQIAERLRHSQRIRPLLGPMPTLAMIKELYVKRLPMYAHADLVIEADVLTSAQIVDAIVEWLHKKKIEF